MYMFSVIIKNHLSLIWISITKYLTLSLQTQTSLVNSPYCLPHNSYNVMSIRSTYYPLFDIFLYSHHFSALYCINIARRNYVFITNVGAKPVKTCI